MAIALGEDKEPLNEAAALDKSRYDEEKIVYEAAFEERACVHPVAARKLSRWAHHPGAASCSLSS